MTVHSDTEVLRSLMERGLLRVELTHPATKGYPPRYTGGLTDSAQKLVVNWRKLLAAKLPHASDQEAVDWLIENEPTTEGLSYDEITAIFEIRSAQESSRERTQPSDGFHRDRVLFGSDGTLVRDPKGRYMTFDPVDDLPFEGG